MEIKDQIMKELKAVDEHIDRLEKQANEQSKLNGTVHTEIREDLKKSADLYKSIKERLDSVETEYKRLGAGQEQAKGFNTLLADAIGQNADKLKALKNGEATAAAFDVKSAVTMTQGDSLTGEVIPATRVPGFYHDPDRTVHVRQFLQVASTDSNVVRYVVEDEYEDGTAITAEGIAKPKSSFELEAKDAPVRKIATHMKISTEMLDDVAGLAGYITTRGTSKYRLREDQQLLYGTGLSNQIEGLTVASAPYSAALQGVATNEYDVVLDALAQLAQREYMASGIMINPARWYNLLRAKDNEGRYILPDAVRFGLTPPQIDGVPLIASTAVATNDFLVANFAQMATLYDRQSVNVRFFEQNEDDAIKNLVTVVIEGRLALPIYLPNAGVYGSFNTAIGS